MIQLQKMISMRLALMLGGLSMPSLKREEGQTLVEYALILVGIAIVVTVIIGTLGDKISSLFSTIADKV